MKYGLTDSEFHFLIQNIVNPLKSLNAKVYIFGSRATGRHKKFSDIDLLFVADPSRKINSQQIYSITTFLENSNFPYKVDLVSADELAESYRAGVEAEKIEI